MKVLRHIPNFLTLLNLSAGIISIVFAMNGQLYYAGWLVVAAAFFDLFDGMAARALKVKSDIGADLDSLADAISFGLAPAMIMYKLMWLNIVKDKLTYLPSELFDRPIGWEVYIFPFIAFWITILGVIRLARFNNDTRQNDTFIGLPIPASGLFFAFMPVVLKQLIRMDDLSAFQKMVLHALSNNFSMAITVLIIASFMVLPIRMFSLKKVSTKPSNWLIPIAFFIVGVVLFFFVGYVAIQLLIILYIIYSLTNQILGKNEIQSAH